MATKSMTKNVVIRSKPLARSFIRAVEEASNKSSKDVVIGRTVQQIKGEKLKELFGKENKT